MDILTGGTLMSSRTTPLAEATPTQVQRVALQRVEKNITNVRHIKENNIITYHNCVQQ